MNPSTRLLLTDGMAPYGFSILAVSNGAEAIEILGKENGVRAVFLNLQLSGRPSALVAGSLDCGESPRSARDLWV